MENLGKSTKRYQPDQRRAFLLRIAVRLIAIFATFFVVGFLIGCGTTKMIVKNCEKVDNANYFVCEKL